MAESTTLLGLCRARCGNGGGWSRGGGEPDSVPAVLSPGWICVLWHPPEGTGESERLLTAGADTDQARLPFEKVVYTVYAQKQQFSRFDQAVQFRCRRWPEM